MKTKWMILVFFVFIIHSVWAADGGASPSHATGATGPHKKGDRPLAQLAATCASPASMLNSNDFSSPSAYSAYLTMCADLAKQQQAGATGGGPAGVFHRVQLAGGE
ncbi:MAG: hypothetical protein AABY86_12570, partial [Bdellovibrionota bacterium]